MFFLFRPLRLLLKGLLTESTPRQLSMGIALGAVIGLVPKGNLLAITLGMLLAATRVNLAIAGASAVTFTLIAMYLDPISDKVGYWLLNQPSLQNFWTSLYNTPMMPWTDFNNTIVLGSFTIGLLLIWPIHRLTLPWISEYSGSIADYARRFWLARLLFGAEWPNRMSSVN